MGALLGVAFATVGAAIGLGFWIGLMWVFDTVCRGFLNFMVCGGTGGFGMLDLLSLPILVIGAGAYGWGLGQDAAMRLRTR